MSSSARVRDNQRRSRARRKEYIQELEQRLQQFETFGVEATREVQMAGRRVAAENAALRSLLRHRGVTDEEVREYMETHTSNPGQFTVSSATAPKTRISKAMGTRNYHEKNDSSPRTDIGGFNPLPSELAGNTKGEKLNGQLSRVESSVPVDPLTHISSNVEQSNGRRDTGDSTSCEVAAGIIMSMRGHADMRDVRSELGCGSSSSCMVRNMHIFEILDT